MIATEIKFQNDDSKKLDFCFLYTWERRYKRAIKSPKFPSSVRLYAFI